MTDLAPFEGHMALIRVFIDQLEEYTPENIRRVISTAPITGLSEEVQEAIARYFETQYNVVQALGHAVKSDKYRPWLASNRLEIDFHYWNRLRKYLLEKDILPPRVISTLDTVTDELLDYAGNPKLEGDWVRRGMVLGHVQSGKTSNYSALICKASDAGYKVIILLAGITNSLRKQTQERIDDAFIGRRAIFSNVGAGTRIGAAKYADGNAKHPTYGTTVDQDFSRSAATGFGVSMGGEGEPVIFVTKKNVSTLKNLKAWLESQYPNGGIPYPLILIDDEADNASINTSNNPDRVTRINSSIRSILAMFQRSSYVGYTATPFANIFVDPDSIDEMLQDDLFPRDYIKALDPPNNYVGPREIFEEGGNLSEQMVRIVDDYEDILPLKHKNGHPVTALPSSLYAATRVFIVARAIRVLRGHGKNHCSMMVNVSRFNSVQEAIEGEIYQYLQTLKEAISVNSGMGVNGLKNPHVLSLKKEFDSEFGNLEFSWNDVQRVLHETADSIIVSTVNMRGGALDYSRSEETGLHVIAVGGLALSRGLTLEGLCITYILRNAGAYDTLMQMGRWFGYRPGYEDICRLYIPEFARDYYEFISNVTEELRDEISRMEALGLTPKDFGLKVRENPATIRITAANKMRTAQKVRIAAALDFKHVEGHTLWNKKKINTANRSVIQDFISNLGTPSGERNGEKPCRLFWGGVSLPEIIKFMQSFELPPANTELGQLSAASGGAKSSLALDYMGDRPEELSDWDVCLPENSRTTAPTDSSLIQGQNIRCRTRHSGHLTPDDSMYRVTGSRQKVAVQHDPGFGLSINILDEGERTSDRSYNLKRQKPLLIIHVFDGKIKDNEPELDIGGSCFSYSICFPSTGQEVIEREYQVNLVWQQSAESDEDEDAESIDD